MAQQFEVGETVRIISPDNDELSHQFTGRIGTVVSYNRGTMTMVGIKHLNRPYQIEFISPYKQPMYSTFAAKELEHHPPKHIKIWNKNLNNKSQ